VFPLSTEVLSKWQDEGGPSYAIDSIGSGGGFERFCVDGASDISNASRPIKQEEIDACAEIGRTPIEIRVGTDALSLVISNGNYFAQSLTIEQLGLAFSLPEGSTWADVDPAFPAHPIQRFSPGADSGTFDYFNEVVFDEADTSPILEAGVEIVGENDNTTVTGVANDGCTEGDLTSVCAIGYFGYAYYQQNAGDLQVVSVEGITPSDETVNEGTYPLARPLFMYTDAGIVAEKPQVAAFIAYYLQHVNSVIGEVGYFPAPMEALQGAADAIKAAAGW
jgi:phosphate transport system substrate-binding protein